jgi:hypothetical protein
VPTDFPAAAAMGPGAVKTPAVSVGAKAPASPYQPPAPSGPLGGLGLRPPPNPFQSAAAVPGQAFSGLASGFQSAVAPARRAVTGAYDMAGYRAREAATTAHPPLSYVTGGLGQLAGPVNSGLRFVQKAIADPSGADPANRPGAARFGSIAAPLAAPLLQAGPLGVLGLVGAYGALSGGESYAALQRMFRPVTSG